MTIQPTTLCERWQLVRSTWSQLHAQMESPTFFLSKHWMDAWLKVFGDQFEGEFIEVLDAGKPQGIALLLSAEKHIGPLKKKSLYLNTAGERDGSPMVEHNTVVAAKASQDKVWDALQTKINGMAWDEFNLNGIITDQAPRFGQTSKTFDNAWRSAPYVDLEQIRGAGKSYIETLSKNKRSQVRRSIKLYEQRGELAIQRATCVDDALTWFEELKQLHQAVWIERGKPGAFASSAFGSFHQHVISLGVPVGEVDLLKISAGTDVIGIVYNLRFNGHISYYQSGFKYETDNKLKPGLVCHALAIQEAIDSNAHTYDFLAAANQDASYKDSLANQTRELGWQTFQQPSLGLKAFSTAEKVYRKLKRITS